MIFPIIHLYRNYLNIDIRQRYEVKYNIFGFIFNTYPPNIHMKAMIVDKIIKKYDISFHICSFSIFK